LVILQLLSCSSCFQ